MSDEILYNVMIVLMKIYDRQSALRDGEFNSENGKLIMASTLAQLELLIDLYGPKAEDEPAKKKGIIDGIISKF